VFPRCYFFASATLPDAVVKQREMP